MVTTIFLPEWLIGEKYVTFATWGLVLVTLILALVTLALVLDSRANRREQRQRWIKEDQDHLREHEELLQRWKREDAVRDSAADPKADFGLRSNRGGDFTLWSANLGTSSFLLVRLRMVHLVGEKQDQIHEFEPAIVPVGQSIEIRLPTLGWQDGNWEVYLALRGPQREVTTSAKLYYLLFADDRAVRVQTDLRGLETISCPKCKVQVTNFEMGGLASKADVQQELEQALGDLQRSCPEHESSSPRVRFPSYIRG